MAVVEFQNATRQYRANGTSVTALDDVSFDIEAGRFAAVVGRSGCGKSTLLNLAGAMDFPSSGQVRINGISTASLDDAGLTRVRRNDVGFIFQFFQLLPALTVAENVELPLLLAGKRNVRKPAMERLRWVEMEEYGDRHPHQLSGGQMQRVAIARALVHDPTLLLADEPIGNLDSKTGLVVIELLRRTAVELGTTVLMATHSLESAEVCDRVIRLRDGRVRLIEEH